MSLNKQAAALAAKINKDLGAEVVVPASEIRIPRTFTSGSLSLDIALGGGWPANHWIEIRGEQSNGKTAIALKTIAANQAADPGFTTAWVAAEHWDVDQARALGVDDDRVVVIDTRDMEIAYDSVIKFAESRTVDCIVIDSYPALTAPEEEAKGIGEVQVALGARLTNKFFRLIGTAMKRNLKDPGDRPILGLFINQFRDAIGVFSPMGTPKTTLGGKGKNYAFYVQIDVKRDEYIEEKVPGKNLKVKVGQTIKITTVKNKQAPPRQVASIDFYFREAPQLGFHRGEYDTVKETLTMGLVYDLIRRGGAYFTYGDDRWQGRDAMLQAFREQPDLLDRLDTEVREIALHGQGGRELTAEAVSEANATGQRIVRRVPSTPSMAG